MDKYSDETWDRFLDFIFPRDDQLTDEEVKAELKRLGIDVEPAIARVREALRERARKQASGPGE